MAAMAQLRFSPLSGSYHTVSGSDARAFNPHSVIPFPCSFPPRNRSLPLINPKVYEPTLPENLQISFAGGDGSDRVGRGGGDNSNGGSGDWGNRGNSDDDPSSSSSNGLGILGMFLAGWRSRVAADPQFAFKVLMEELVGVSACIVGDMASRPNFGLNELDFVFSTLVVGSILNFTLMYLLAPTVASSSSSTLPSVFASCPTSHMFESGAYGILDRFGTLVYKGTVFAVVGFAAGLVGTAISNGLIMIRKKMDPNFKTPNKQPPTLLNAMTWAAHMGFGSNLRYQTLNGIEFVLEKGLPPLAFKASVVVLRLLNNVVGGMTFVMLARFTGSQSVSEQQKPLAVAAEKERLESRGEDMQSSK